jgi:hypothetical protein
MFKNYIVIQGRIRTVMSRSAQFAIYILRIFDCQEKSILFVRVRGNRRRPHQPASLRGGYMRITSSRDSPGFSSNSDINKIKINIDNV